MFGLTKQALLKANGKVKLTWKELESVVLNIEITLNNLPRRYIEDDIHTPNLTPNLMILGQPNFELEGDEDNTKECNLKKRAKRICSCKNRVWSRYTKDYLKDLREQHSLIQNSKELKLKEVDVVVIRGDEKNKAHWKTVVFHSLLPGRDGITKAVRLRAGKSYMERAVQHLHPLELRYDLKLTKDTNENQFDVNTRNF